MSVAARQFRQPRRLFPMVFNPGYTEVQAQGVWGDAVLGVIKDWDVVFLKLQIKRSQELSRFSLSGTDQKEARDSGLETRGIVSG